MKITLLFARHLAACLAYQPDAALRSGVSRQSAQRMLANFFCASLTTPHGPLLPVADRRPLVGHLGEL